MILVDTSIWVDHLRKGVPVLAEFLEQGSVLVHPFVIGELALGNLRHRSVILDALSNLPRANVASDAEVLGFIEQRGLFGRGIGYVDAHLLTAVQLTADSELWTRDKRLHSVASALSLSASSLA